MLHNALRSAIATRRGYCDWTVDHAGWVVMLLSPEEQTFYGRTLEEALAWCLVWLMASEIGLGPSSSDVFVRFLHRIEHCGRLHNFWLWLSLRKRCRRYSGHDSPAATYAPWGCAALGGQHVSPGKHGIPSGQHARPCGAQQPFGKAVFGGQQSGKSTGQAVLWQHTYPSKVQKSLRNSRVGGQQYESG